MLHASRVLGSPGIATRVSARELAKQAVVGLVKHARDTKGAAQAGTTLYWEPLPSKLGAVSGDEMSEDNAHWFIDELVWGPYQDALGQEVFLTRVSGINDFGEEVNWILWEHQRVDIPTKLVHSCMQNLDPESIFEEPPLRELVEEAYANARLHLHNFDLEVDE
jgi:hypothetical protein